jgi:hypothetical protein
MEKPKAVLHEFATQLKASSDMIDPWQMQCAPKSLLVPPKFPYITIRSLKPPTCSPIPLPWDIKHCSLVVMSRGGVSYLITTINWCKTKGMYTQFCLTFRITLMSYNINNLKCLDFIHNFHCESFIFKEFLANLWPLDD